MPTYAELVNADSIEVDDIRSTAAGATGFSAGLKTDTIAEDTVGAGVTIDGVLLKDSEVLSSQLNLNLQSWVPTVSASGSMTVSSLAINFAKYADLGDAIWVFGNLIFTLGGTADTNLYITPPVNIASAPTSFSANLTHTGVVGYGFIYDATHIAIRPYDSSNWTLGTLRGVAFNGILPKA